MKILTISALKHVDFKSTWSVDIILRAGIRLIEKLQGGRKGTNLSKFYDWLSGDSFFQAQYKFFGARM